MKEIGFMDCNRHIILDSPDKKIQIQIYEYDDNMVVWLGTSPEIYSPKEGKATKEVTNNFVSTLQSNGCTIISDRCA